MFSFGKKQFAYVLAGATVLAISLGGVAVLRAASASPASVPASLTQQGRILDATGAPVSGKVAITFTVYDDPKASAAADALWTETQNLTLDDGYFSTQLGADTANTFADGTFDGSIRYLGVQVGSDDEMTPRQVITSVPYALHAGLADKATAATGALDTRIAALEAFQACPDATARAKLGFCIWEEGGGAYAFTLQTAAAACTAKGARLCTLAEVSAAQAAGAQWCDNAWVADRVNNSTGYIAYPMQTVIGGCGNVVGVVSGQQAFTSGADANCCKL
jgi:hypothetical protein